MQRPGEGCSSKALVLVRVPPEGDTKMGLDTVMAGGALVKDQKWRSGWADGGGRKAAWEGP